MSVGNNRTFKKKQQMLFEVVSRVDQRNDGLDADPHSRKKPNFGGKRSEGVFKYNTGVCF